MRIALFIILCLLASPIQSYETSPIYVEDKEGFVRVHNTLGYVVHCYVDSGTEYYEFTVSPSATSRWYKVSQAYIWNCG